MRSALIATAAALCFVAASAAQQAGPTQTSVKMSGKIITLKHSSTAMAGRKIVGGVVPLDKVWLPGDAAVTFHTEADLEVQGLPVPKGDYLLYVLPDAKEWQLIISKLPASQAASYTQKMDLGRVPMDMKKAPAPVENLRLSLTSLGTVAGKLELAWENTIASVPFNLDIVKASAEW
jgi:hypothetical protein